MEDSSDYTWAASYWASGDVLFQRLIDKSFHADVVVSLFLLKVSAL